MGTTSVVIKLSVEQKQALADIETFKQSFGGIAKVGGIIAAALGVVGIGGLIKKALGEAVVGEQFETMLDAIATRAGYAKPYIDSLVESIRKYDVTSDDAREVLTRMIATELGVERATKLANAARDLSVISQRSVAEVMKDVLAGSLTLQSRSLRDVGIYVNLEQAIARVAKARGVDVNAMSMQEKQSIAFDTALNAMARYEGAYAAASDKAGVVIGKMKVYLSDMFEALGRIGLPALKEGAQLVKDFASETEKWAEANGKVLAQDVAGWARKVGEEVRTAGGFVKGHSDEIRAWGTTIVEAAIIFKLGEMAQKAVLLGEAIKTAGWLAMGAAGPIAIIAAAVAGWIGLTNWLNAEGAKNATKERDAVVSLAQEYLTLASKTERTAEENQRFHDVTEQLNKILPGSVQGLNDETDALDRLTDAEKAARVAAEYDLAMKIKQAEVALELAKNTANMPPVGGEGEIAANAAARQVDAIEAELKRLREIQASLWTMTPEQIAAMGPHEALLPTVPSREDVTKAKEEWAKIIDDLHKMRLEAIADDYEKEKALLGEKYAKLYADISAATGVTPEKKAEATDLAYHEGYLVERGKIDKKHDDETKKALEETEKAKAKVLVDALQTNRDLYGWDTKQYETQLELQLADAALSYEERKALEEELLDVQRKAAVDARQKVRQAYADIKASFIDAATTAITSAKNAHEAWASLGTWIEGYLIKGVLSRLIDAFAKVIPMGQAAENFGPNFMGPQSPGSGIMGFISSLLPFLFQAQSGMYTTRPSPVVTYEHGQPEITSPVAMMRQIVREEVAAAGGGGIRVYVPVQAFDAPSIERSARSGPLHDALVNAVREGWLRLGTG